MSLHTRRHQTGSVLAMVMLLIVAASILIMAVGNGLTATRIQTEATAADTELIYAATGFIHMIRGDIVDGNVGQDLAPHNMNGANIPYVMNTNWGGRQVSSVSLVWSLTDGQAAGEKVLLVRATTQIGESPRSVDVSVTLTTQEPLPIDGWFGSALKIGAGLTTNTPVGVRGDINGFQGIADDEITFNQDVNLTGKFNIDADIAGTGTINPNTDVPLVTFDIPKMVTDMLNDSTVKVTALNLPAQQKGVKIVFNPNNPEVAELWYSEAAINSVDRAFVNGAPNTTGPFYVNLFRTDLNNPASARAGAVLNVLDAKYVVVEGTYSKPITIVSQKGAIQIGGSLQLQDGVNDVPPIGLVSAGTPGNGLDAHDGSVYIRRAKNENDYGFQNNSVGVIDARIYAKGKLNGFNDMSNGRIASLTLNTSLIIQGGGTDLGEIATSRTINSPKNMLTSPGMNRTRIIASNPTPKFKVGSWATTFN